MSIRREPTYLSTDTWRALRIVAKSKEVTPDELANTILDEVLWERYPTVVNFIKEMRKLEREIQEAISQ